MLKLVTRMLCALMLAASLSGPAIAALPPGLVKLGDVKLAPGVKSNLSGGMALGTAKLGAPNQSFTVMLRQELAMALGQSVSETAPVELTGTLLGGFAWVRDRVGQAGLAAEFVLTRDGVEVFRKRLEVNDRWPGSFGGSVDAAVHFGQLFPRLAQTLAADPEFRAALAAP